MGKIKCLSSRKVPLCASDKEDNAEKESAFFRLYAQKKPPKFGGFSNKIGQLS
jgi:hypothetical protein